MNLTLLSLSTSLLSASPLFTLTNYAHSIHFSSQKIQASNFYNNFIFSYAKSFHTTFYQSSFCKFLNTPLLFNEDAGEELKRYTHQTYQTTQKWTNDAELFVISCTFEQCQAGNDERGGGIKFVKSSSTLTVHGCIFNYCKAKDGGGVFACAEEKKTNDDSNDNKDQMTHVNMQKFNSQYCCYSFCTAKTDDSDVINVVKNKGYGSALLVAATDINLNYSSTFQCPSHKEIPVSGNVPSYGAQFDIKTENIDSCNINATSGYSYACSAIEYREAKKGTFKFQTVVDQKGGFITSFTKLQGEVEISECNFVKNTVKWRNFNPTLCAIIHVRIKSVTISNFCFSEITFEGYDGIEGNKRIASKGSDIVFEEFTITIKNCLLDSSLSQNQQTYFTGISAEDNSFPDQLKTKEISQLKLGYCEGEDEPPRTFETSYFSNSEAFSYSLYFSNSNEFTSSKGFSASDDFLRTKRFTSSRTFTPSKNFTSSKSFTPSKNFTHSNLFSSSVMFTNSDDFTLITSFPTLPVNLQERDNKKPVAAIAGGVIGGVAAIALIAFIIAYFIRKKKMLPNTEDVETITDSTGTVENKNPLYNKAGDDPFKEDFE